MLCLREKAARVKQYKLSHLGPDQALCRERTPNGWDL